MSRYIDAEWLIKEAMPLSFSIQKWVNEVQINDAPSIDIVFCEHCKYWTRYEDGDMRCKFYGYKTADDFCSYGCRAERSSE